LAYQRTPYVESKRAQARERLVAAGLDLLKAGGWREVQMSAVAAAAGLSTGAVYLHFPSKAQLLSELYRTQAAAELRVLSAIADQDAPAAARLEAAIRAYAQRALANRRLGYAMMFEPAELEVEEERLHAHVQYIAMFRGMVEAAVRAGEFEAQDPQVTAACILGAVMESLIGPFGAGLREPRAAGTREEVQRLVDGLVAFCLRGVAPKGVPPRPRRTAPSPAGGRRPGRSGATAAALTPALSRRRERKR
jgi:AcrR family transcriptional regulator